MKAFDINKIYDLIDKKKFDAALKLMDKYSDLEASNAQYCCIKGMLIQAANDCLKYELIDSKKMFLKAIKLDRKFYRAHVELGYYYYVFDDNYKKAIEHFEKAIDNYSYRVTDGILGKAKSLSEIRNNKAAVKFLEKFKANPLNMDEIDSLIEELKSF